MAGQTVDDATQQLWRSYANQITQKIAGGGDLGPNNAVFVCPLTTQGLASGKYIIKEVTNKELYRCADGLLNDDSPVYVPGKGSYSNTLLQYIRNVMLPTNPLREALIRLENAKEELDRSEKAYFAANKEARAAYVEIEGEAAPKRVELEKWAARSFPALLRTKDVLSAANNRVNQIQDEINGPGAADLARRRNALIAAQNEAEPNIYNMPCVDADIDAFNAMRDGKEYKAENVYYQPAYSITGLKAQVDEWIERAAMKQVGDSISFSISDGKTTSWSNSGFSNVNASANASAWCFFQASASSSSSESHSSSSLDIKNSNISVKITFVALKAFPIDAGKWDIPDVKTMYPTLFPSAPKEIIRGLIQPKRMLLGYAPGMEVTFDADTYNRVESAMSNAKSTSASVSIFGFCIGGSGSGSSASGGSTSFNDVKMDKQSLKLTIPPMSNNFPVLVGVLGMRN